MLWRVYEREETVVGIEALAIPAECVCQWTFDNQKGAVQVRALQTIDKHLYVASDVH